MFRSKNPTRCQQTQNQYQTRCQKTQNQQIQNQ